MRLVRSPAAARNISGEAIISQPEEGSEFEARHGVSLRIYCSFKGLGAKLRGGGKQGNPRSLPPAHGCRAKAGDLPSSGISRPVARMERSAIRDSREGVDLSRISF